MTIEFLDPTHEAAADGFALAPRLSDVAGVTVGIVSNGKKNTGPFFDALEQALLAAGVGRVEQVVKGNYSAPMEADVIQQAERWQALVSGIGD